MKANSNAQFQRGSGNVFADLGFSPEEAANLRLRSQLLTALRKYIERSGMTQAESARRFRVTQPRISDLVRGKLSRFSLDTLVKLAEDAGLDVEFRIRERRRVA